MVSLALFCALLLVPCAADVEPAGEGSMTFTVYSHPVQLRYGEVFNKMQEMMDLPKEVVERYAGGKKLMAIFGFDVDMVRREADGTDTQVSLDDHYLHHYALNLGEEDSMRKLVRSAAPGTHLAHHLSGCHAMTRSGIHDFANRLQLEDVNLGRIAMFGSASGAEYRDNLQRFDAPYRMVLNRPAKWSPLVHIISTNSRNGSLGGVSPLIECPCTPQRRIDVAKGTIDGRLPEPPIHCSAYFDSTGNTACHVSTYVGGWRCCEHNMFLIDTDKECQSPTCGEKPRDEVFLKFKFYYEDASPLSRPIEPAACCDVTGVTQGFENIEYDIPQCRPGTPPEQCTHVAESVQPLGYFGQHPKSPYDQHQASDLIDLVFAAPHLHVAGISITLQDAKTNKTLCEVSRADSNIGGVKYGQGSGPGDEKDYLVGLRTCRWSGDNAPRFSRDHPMRTRAVYNASRSATGVMSLWLMNVAAVNEPLLMM